jgi:DNA end-binding protein Ku
MPRSIWNGTVTFGLIAVPIKVHSAIEDKGVHFHQVHDKDGARIKQKRMCSKEGKEVPYKEVAKGYEVREGEYVLLAQEQIDAAAGEGSHTIALDEFVCAEHIDPVFYDRTYYLGASEEGEDAYRLLHDALKRSKRAGLGRWVFHNREYLVAIRPMNGALGLHTMRFADELVAVDELDVPEASRPPSKQEIDMAGRLVESLHARFRPGSFKDTYRERVLALIERKAKGEEIEIEEPEEAEATPDLMAALEASLGSSKSRGSKSKSKSGASKSGGSKSTSRSSSSKSKAKASTSKSRGKGSANSKSKSKSKTRSKS